jgi:phage repressor protein C with HTH and peptisase S24 domain
MLLGEKSKKLREAAGIRLGDFAKKAKMSASAYSQFESGLTKSLKPENLINVARAHGLTAEEFVENNMSLSVRENIEPYDVTVTKMRGRVPLISWVRAGSLCDVSDPLHPGDAEEWLPCPVNHGPRTFALRIVGESMMPEYRESEIIYVDPDIEAKHNDDVVVRTPENKVTFKRLQRTQDGTYLLALNPDLPDRIIKVPDDTIICGVVIFSGIVRKR